MPMCKSILTKRSSLLAPSVNPQRAEVWRLTARVFHAKGAESTRVKRQDSPELAGYRVEKSTGTAYASKIEERLLRYGLKF